MGNELNNKQRAKSDGKSVYLALRCRDIILHYSYKMKLIITDICLFPHGLQGLKIWDTDVVLSRYIISQNQRFSNKSALVIKGGVGIVGITLSKWAGCRKVDMCDINRQVVDNMNSNCQRNGLNGIRCFEANIDDHTKYTQKYDLVFVTDILNQRVKPHIILNLWRKVLKIGGQGIMVMPENRQKARNFLDNIDREEFKISNLLLTSEQYEASPLLNKLQGQIQFPLLGNTPFYVISLQKLKQMPMESEKENNSNVEKIDSYKTPKRQSKLPQTKSQKIVQSQKQVNAPVSMLKTKMEQERNESPIRKLQKKVGNQEKQLSEANKIIKVEQNLKPESEGL